MRYDDITDGVDGGEAEAARAPRQVAALQEPEAVVEPLDMESVVALVKIHSPACSAGPGCRGWGAAGCRSASPGWQSSPIRTSS